MNVLIMIFALIAVFFMVVIAAVTNKETRSAAFQRKDREQAPIKARFLLTPNDQMTFIKLHKALPDCFVLTQVAMASLLNSSGLVTRNKINRYCVDFVVLDKYFNIIAIIEVDPPQQKKNMLKISERDTMLMEAGYRVIRYTHAPDIEQIISDFSQLMRTQKVKQSRAAVASTTLPDDVDNFFNHDY